MRSLKEKAKEEKKKRKELKKESVKHYPDMPRFGVQFWIRADIRSNQ